MVDVDDIPGYLKETAIDDGALQERISVNEELTFSTDDFSERNIDLQFSNFTWKDLNKAYVRHLLKKNNWVVTRAAKDAGVKRSTFDSRMKKLGIRK